MLPRVLLLLSLLLGSSSASRSSAPVDREWECHSFVQDAQYSAATSKKHVTGCKCPSAKQQVFCGYDPSPVFARKFIIPKSKHACEGRMYCAEAVRTTTTTTTSTFSGKDHECRLFVKGSRWAGELVSMKKIGCKCPEDERVFCRDDPRPVLDNEFLISSSKHPCESEMYCAVWAKGSDEYESKPRRPLFEPWMDSEEDQSTSTIPDESEPDSTEIASTTGASTEAVSDDKELSSISEEDDDDDDYRSLLSDAGRAAIREAETGEIRDDEEFEDYRSPFGSNEAKKEEDDVSTKQNAKVGALQKRKVTPHTATEDDIFNMYYKSEAEKKDHDVSTRRNAKPKITPHTATEEDIFNMYYKSKSEKK